MNVNMNANKTAGVSTLSPATGFDKKKLLDELTSLKQEVNHLYFVSRKKDELIKSMEDTAAETKVDLLAKIERLSSENIGQITETNRLIDMNRNFEAQIAQLMKVKQALLNEMTELRKRNKSLESNVSAQNKVLRRNDFLVKENKSLTAQVQQLKFGVGQNDTTSKKEHSDQYEVEKILAHEIERNQTWFLIRWKDYDESYDTWERENNLQCANLLKKYWKSIEH